MIHATSRMKGIIDKLYDLGISVSYSRVTDISSDVGDGVL